MDSSYRISFASRLASPPQAVWDWIVSAQGIAAELRPWLFMSAPSGVKSLVDVSVQPGRRLFRSWIFLFGLIPIDYSDLTLQELQPGAGFVEQSPMGSMRLWRHERRLSVGPEGVLLVDHLTFRPRFARALIAWFIRQVFKHRHRVLVAHFGGCTLGPEHH
jgi:ligand-binding SRPBCC domain-containing protein